MRRLLSLLPLVLLSGCPSDDSVADGGPGDGGPVEPAIGPFVVDGGGDGGPVECEVGFVEEDGTCVDVDECADETADCDPVAECTNTEGGFGAR